MRKTGKLRIMEGGGGAVWRRGGGEVGNHWKNPEIVSYTRRNIFGRKGSMTISFLFLSGKGKMENCQVELEVVGSGKRRNLQSSQIKKGQKWGVKIARDKGKRGVST